MAYVGLKPDRCHHVICAFKGRDTRRGISGEINIRYHPEKGVFYLSRVPTDSNSRWTRCSRPTVAS